MAAKGKPKVVGTLESIRAAPDVLGTVEVWVEEWDCMVVVRGLKRGEIKAIYKAAEDTDDAEERMDILTLAAAMVDLKLTEEEAASLLQEKGLRPIKTILQAIMEASGLTDGFR